jgi:hypothetical protein
MASISSFNQVLDSYNGYSSGQMKSSALSARTSQDTGPFTFTQTGSAAVAPPPAQSSTVVSLGNYADHYGTGDLYNASGRLVGAARRVANAAQADTD